MRNSKSIKHELIQRDGLRCAVSGDTVETSEELSIEHIVPKSKGGTDNLDNLILVKKSLSALVSDDEKNRTHLLVEELKRRQEELTNRERENFHREQSYRHQIEQQKQQLEEFRLNLQKEQSERQAAFEREMSEQRNRMLEQQKTLVVQESQLSALKSKLHQDLQEKERQIVLAFEELEREKERYREDSRSKIETRSSAYVNEALKALDSSSNKYRTAGTIWSVAGSLAIVAGVITGLYFGVLGLTPFGDESGVSWAQVCFFAFKGVIVIGLFVALAKYCFAYGQSFTHESIKNSERKHAINFGKFYLETYGADAKWHQIKEAFEHWNINSSSAFSGNDTDKFDPKVIETAIKFAETVQKINKSKIEDDNVQPK